MVNGDGADLFKPVNKALVAQIAERQRFRVCTDGHQGYDFAFVDVQVSGDSPGTSTCREVLCSSTAVTGCVGDRPA